MTGNEQQLRDAVDGLYATFGSYPLKSTTDVCWHCHSPTEEQALHLVPMREMTPDDLEGFASDLLMTWGDLADFKHFLPRLFEIVAFDHFTDDHPDIETVLGALDRGEWSSWPTAEREAIGNFLRAFWTANLGSWPSGYEIETVLASIAQAETDLSPYLAAWGSMEGPAPVLHFCDLLLDNATRIALGKGLSNPWFGPFPDRESQVRDWLQHERASFAPKVEAHFAATTDEHALELLAAALDVIEQ